MNFELEHRSAVPAGKEKETLDDKWYKRFSEAASFEISELLFADITCREEQKEKFIKDEIENPEIAYPKLESFDFKGKEHNLLELKKDIINNEPNTLVKQVYRWRINEEIAKLRMLRSSKERNDKKFNRYSEFIYGKPNKEVYAYTLNQVRKIIEDKISSNDPDIKSAAKRLQKELLESKEDVPIANSLLEEYIFPELRSIENEDKYSSEEIGQAFEAALADYQIKGWKVLVDTENKNTAINVSRVNKEIRVPQKRELKQTKLAALIAHEIGTHVVRRERGERSKLKILGLGLDRYLKGEEGVATYQEQKIYGAEYFSGFDLYFTTSLASGVDGKKRTFREVFKILKDFYFIKSKKEKKEAWESSVNSAWNQCTYIFKGTTNKTPGACFTKEIVYREGNIGVWDVVRNNPEEERRFSVGKYDPSNPRHIWILDQLGINDDDLEELES